MAISWGAWSSGYSNNARLGHEYSVSGVTIYINTWLEFQYSLNDAQTLHFSSATGSWGGSVNYTKNGPSAQMIHSYSVNGSRGGNYHFGNYLSGVYNGANPSIDTWVGIPYANPSTPGHPSVSEVTATSALLHSGGVADNGGAPIDNWRYQVSNTPSFGGYVDWGGTPWRMTGLTRATHYYFRIQVRNSANYWSDWSSVGEFDTLPTKPGKENTPSVTEVTANSFKVTYTGNADGGGIPITANQLQVATDSSFNNLVYNGQPTNNYTVTGLAAAQTYFVRVRAYNAQGWSDSWSDPAQVTTGATVPGQVGGVTTSGAITQDAATLVWSAPTNGGSAITGYTVQIATNTGFTAGLQTFSPTSASQALTGLVPGTTYYTRVRANNAVGNGPYSATGSFTTISGKPQIVNDVAGLELTRTSGRMGAGVWAQGWTGNFTITVQVSLVDTFATTIKTLTLTPGSVTSNQRYGVQDTLVQANGTYFVRARVKNNTTAYESEWSDVASYSQSHTPVAQGLTPTGDIYSPFATSVPLTFRFLDTANPFDQRSAYRVVVENNSTGATIVDSGKVASVSTGTNPELTYNAAFIAAHKNVRMRWRVMVWDSNDQSSAWSSYNLFTLADVPTVIITTPPNGTPVTTGNPSFLVNVTIPSTGSQASTTYTVREQATSAVVWSQTYYGTNTSGSPGQTVLQNGKAYNVTIEVTDSFGLKGSAVRSFTVTYIQPGSPTYTISESATVISELGYVLIDWSTTQPDPYITSWVVYRRELPSTNWELLAEVVNVGQLQYQDWRAPAGKSYQYTVTQRASRSGVILESPLGYYQPLPNHRRRNYSHNPSFEANTTGVVVGGTGYTGAVTLQTTGGYSGQNFARLTVSAITTPATPHLVVHGPGNRADIGATTNLPVSGGVWVRANKVLSLRLVGISSTAITAGTTTSVNGATVVTVANTWVFLPITFPANASARQFIEFRVSAVTPAQWTAGLTLDVDAVLIERNVAQPGTFFDGSTLDPGYSNTWVGTATISQSEQLGALVSENRIAQAQYDNYWLLSDDPSKNMIIGSVKSDSFSEEFESASYHVIGRGRHRDNGDRIGYSGTLTLQLRGLEARDRRRAIEEARAANDRRYLRTPFGDLFPVALGDPQVERIPGTSVVEMTDLTLPYEEVY